MNASPQSGPLVITDVFSSLVEELIAQSSL